MAQMEGPRKVYIKVCIILCSIYLGYVNSPILLLQKMEVHCLKLCILKNGEQRHLIIVSMFLCCCHCIRKASYFCMIKKSMLESEAVGDLNLFLITFLVIISFPLTV